MCDAVSWGPGVVKKCP